LIAHRSRAGASAFERRLQLRVAAGLEAKLFALIDYPACRGELFELAEFRLDDLVGLGLLRLSAREAELPLDLGDYIVNAGEILFHPLELPLAHLAPSLEEREAGGFLDQGAQLVRLGLDYFFDTALLDQRVSTAVNLRRHEKFGDVF